MEFSHSFLSIATVFPPVVITNPQILTVIFCTHPHIQYMLKKPSRILNFLDFGDSAVTPRIIPAEPQRCASFLKKVAILLLLYRRAFSAPKRWIASRHCKRRQRKRITVRICGFVMNTSGKTVAIDRKE